ncbi:MAG: PDZ domain-containing protein [Candidatus Bipolaricaulia bacterium]
MSMRWLCVFIAAVLSFSTLKPAIAQQRATLPSQIRANLTDAQLKEFRRSQLSVQVDTKTKTKISANTYTWLLPDTSFLRPTGDRTITKKQIKNWHLYEGFQKVKEPEFFRIAGYPKAARQAKEWHTRGWVVPTAIVGAIAGVGGVVWLASLETYTNQGTTYFRNEGQALVGGVLAGGGLGISLTALIKGKWKDGLWAPPERLRSVASDHNKNLYEKLAGRTSTPERGTAQRNGRLPATTTNVGPTVEEALSLPSGAMKVKSSEVESLQKGDVIISIDGAELKQEESLKQVIKRYSPGDTIQLEILREGENKTVSVTLGGSIGG